MKLFTKVILFSLVVTIVVTMSLLFKYEVISKTVFFSFLFLLIVVEIIGLIFSLSGKLKSMKQSKNNQNSKKSMRYIFDRINDELAQMPDNDVILWERGKDVTSKTKEFIDTNGKNQRFIAMIAQTKYTHKEVIVYYNSTEDIFWDWDSDPAPMKLADPFYKFEPYPSRGYMGRPQDIYNKRKNKKGFRVSFDDEYNDYDQNPNDRNISKFSDSIDYDSKFRI